jgi:hypothetical protein
MILAAGFAVLVAAPSLASAQQTYCERANSSNRVAGTVIGGVAGALLGSAIAGNSSNTAGTVAGGVAGAVVGNQLAKRRNEPCPQGYVESYRNDDRQAYAPAQASPYAWREYGPAYGAAYDSNRFWQGAPSAPEQRVNFLIDRVNQGRADGSLTRGEARRVMMRIDAVQREIRRLRRQDRGQLSARNQNYIQTRLDDISRQISWQRTNYNNEYNNNDYNRGGYTRR